MLIKNELSFGITKKDPFKQCKFYDAAETSFSIQEENHSFFSMLKSPNILEVSLRLYVKDRQIPEAGRNQIVEYLKK